MRKYTWLGLMLILAGLGGWLLTHAPSNGIQAADDKPAKSKPAANKPAQSDHGVKAVEPDMHEFMEYYYKPTFIRLKRLMFRRPRRPGWRNVKADTLILAEGSNLLLQRLPEDNAGEWKTLSVETREHGRKLYAAAKKRDYDTAKKHYTAMITACNKCHQKFAGGEHQLEP